MRNPTPSMGLTFGPGASGMPDIHGKVAIKTERPMKENTSAPANNAQIATSDAAATNGSSPLMRPLAPSFQGAAAPTNAVHSGPDEDALPSLNWLQSVNLNCSALFTAKKNNATRKCTKPQEAQHVMKDRKGKPPFSFACLIAMALSSSPTKRMTVSQIYNWIRDNFPYFKNSTNGWKNSIRHNLSLNKCFCKVPREGGEPGKGSFWRVNPAYQRVIIREILKYRQRLAGTEFAFPKDVELDFSSPRRPLPNTQAAPPAGEAAQQTAPSTADADAQVQSASQGSVSQQMHPPKTPYAAHLHSVLMNRARRTGTPLARMFSPLGPLLDDVTFEAADWFTMDDVDLSMFGSGAFEMMDDEGMEDVEGDSLGESGSKSPFGFHVGKLAFDDFEM